MSVASYATAGLHVFRFNRVLRRMGPTMRGTRFGRPERPSTVAGLSNRCLRAQWQIGSSSAADLAVRDDVEPRIFLALMANGCTSCACASSGSGTRHNSWGMYSGGRPLASRLRSMSHSGCDNANQVVGNNGSGSWHSEALSEYRGGRGLLRNDIMRVTDLLAALADRRAGPQTLNRCAAFCRSCTRWRSVSRSRRRARHP